MFLTDTCDRIGYNENKIIIDDFIYFTYLDSEFYNHVVKCDKKLNIILDKKLNKATDTHGGCSIVKDKKGYIHLLGGGHSTLNSYYYKSSLPNDISEFDTVLFKEQSTYLYLFVIYDKICIIYRQNIINNSNYDKLVYIEKNTDDKDFDYNNKIMINELNNNYVAAYSINVTHLDNKLFLTFNWYNISRDYSESTLTLIKNDNENYFRRIDNTPLLTLITHNDYDFICNDTRNTNVINIENEYYFLSTSMIEGTIEIINIFKKTKNKLFKIKEGFVNSISKVNDHYLLFITMSNELHVIKTYDFINFNVVEKINVYNTLNWNTCYANNTYENEVYFFTLIKNKLLKFKKGVY